MVEPEVAFADLHDIMDLTEAYIKHVVAYVLTLCMEDLNFLNGTTEWDLVSELQKTLREPFIRLSHAEAVEFFLDAANNEETAHVPDLSWGLNSQDEYYLVREVRSILNLMLTSV